MRRWTPRIAIRRSKHRLGVARQALIDVGGTWGDVDQTFVDRADDLLRQLEEFEKEIEETIADRLANGEQIGL